MRRRRNMVKIALYLSVSTSLLLSAAMGQNTVQAPAVPSTKHFPVGTGGDVVLEYTFDSKQVPDVLGSHYITRFKGKVLNQTKLGLSCTFTPEADELGLGLGGGPSDPLLVLRSEERRVGKECRSRWS